jgi:hypothetical protein
MMLLSIYTCLYICVHVFKITSHIDILRWTCDMGFDVWITAERTFPMMLRHPTKQSSTTSCVLMTQQRLLAPELNSLELAFHKAPTVNSMNNIEEPLISKHTDQMFHLLSCHKNHIDVENTLKKMKFSFLWSSSHLEWVCRLRYKLCRTFPGLRMIIRFLNKMGNKAVSTHNRETKQSLHIIGKQSSLYT